MAIKRYKPTSAARRFMTVSAYDEITSKKPEKSLLEDQRKSGGRNSQGKITVRHIGGGNRRKYRSRKISPFTSVRNGHKGKD